MIHTPRNVIVLIALGFLVASSAAGGEIRWRTGKASLPAVAPDEVAGRISELAAGASAHHIIVQFAQPVSLAQRQALETFGLQLLGYLGDNAFFASVSADRLDAQAIARVGSVSAMSGIAQSWKLHPFLNDGNLPTWAVVAPPDKVKGDSGDLMIATYVLFHRDVGLEGDAVRVCEQHGATVRGKLRSINALVAEVPFNNIRALADEDGVQWVEPALPRMEGNNDDNRLRTGANIVQAAPYNLDGSGVTVLVYDAGTVYAGHPDFGTRVHVRDDSGEHYHSTHVAGTIGGSGAASSGQYRGMAPGVIMESYGLQQAGGLHQGFLYTDPCDIEADYSQAINTYGADIASNSIGTNTAPNGYPCEWEGNYGITDVLIDTIVRGDGSNPLFPAPFRVVWANGNERNSGRCGTTYHTTAPPACAKNHITVGAVNSNDDSVTSFTSWGPADDGRMKPDLSAPGCQSNGDMGVTSCTTGGGYQVLCGTSMATPTVAGLSALMMQDFRTHYPSRPDFRNSTLKILFAHTAVDLFNPGPDYQTGYGSVRIQPAIDLMRTSNWLEGEVSQAGTVMLLAIVNPGDPQLKVTLAWDDVPGTPNVNPVLVNDLDLRVYSPSNVRAYPWTLGGVLNPGAPAVRTQENHVDNIEQVLVDSPQTGAWRIEVYGFAVPQGPQPFSLVATPQLIACSHQGIITLDREKYACQSSATIQVVDCDLNTNDSVVENVTVNIASTSEPGGESVILTETGPQTATFRGTIQLSTTNGPGILWVAPGDTVTATYIDADDGQGGTDIVETDTA
ncbi:MAG TPA: S8 family serine peptidase, partial [Phycisphaerae bacterium]|nr:S8 family serine peptidase [Phycisphaerae bacterium]